MAEFKGVVPAIITPMTADGELNEAAFREVMEFNIQAGVHGFWIAGGTGESVLLSDEENNRIAEIAADQNRGRVKAIMHVGAPTTARAVRMAEHTPPGREPMPSAASHPSSTGPLTRPWWSTTGPSLRPPTCP